MCQPGYKSKMVVSHTTLCNGILSGFEQCEFEGWNGEYGC